MTKAGERWEIVRETLKGGRLSVIMPVFNLEDSIGENLRSVVALFDKHGINVEIVPVDDGSSDNTAAVIRDFEPNSPYVTLKSVLLKANSGKGAALKAGFAASTGEYVLLLDGDLDINPKQTAAFFESMIEYDSDIVVGSKRHEKSVVQYPWHRRLVSFVYFSLVRIFVGLKITDTQTGMKLFKRQVLGEALARMLVKTYAFDLELLAIAVSRGAKISEAPVVIRFGNKFGALKPRTVYNMAYDSLAVFYRLKILKYYAKADSPLDFSYEPLVSIVIACPNDSWMLQECLDAISKQTYRKFEVIVLPDEKIQDCGKCRVVPTGKVRPAEKRNLGISKSKGDVIAFIDDDAYPDSHWLEYAIKYFSMNDVGAVGGPGVTPPRDSYLAKLGGRVYSNILVSGNYRYRYESGGVRRDVDDYPSCNLLVRKDILEKINGYRTDFWPGEDTLLCKDIIDSGLRIVYDPWVVVHHHRRALFLPHLRQLGRYAFHRGYFVKRYPSNSMKLSYFIPSLFVAGIFAEVVFAALSFNALATIGAVPLIVYFSILAITTFSLNPVSWILTAFGVLFTHLTYGVKFAHGLLSKRAPCEFIGKDHA